MSTRHRRGSFSRRGAKRPTTWQQDLLSLPLTVAAQQFILDVSPTQIISGFDSTATLKRTIGHIDLFNDGIGSESFLTTVGMCVVTSEAIVASVVPDPLFDLEQDWYYWKAVEPRLSPETPSYSWEFDLKTGRRLREGYRLVFIMEHPIFEVTGHLLLSLRTVWSIP